MAAQPCTQLGVHPVQGEAEGGSAHSSGRLRSGPLSGVLGKDCPQAVWLLLQVWPHSLPPVALHCMLQMLACFGGSVILLRMLNPPDPKISQP